MYQNYPLAFIKGCLYSIQISLWLRAILGASMIDQYYGRTSVSVYIEYYCGPQAEYMSTYMFIKYVLFMNT